MATNTGIKTVTATPAALFAGTAELTGRTFLYARNLDDIMSCKINGRTVEPGEEIKLRFSGVGTQTILAQSNGRTVQVEVQEVA